MWSRAVSSFKRFRWPCIWSCQETNQPKKMLVGKGTTPRLQEALHCTALPSYVWNSEKPWNNKFVQYSNHLQNAFGFCCNCSCGCPCADHPPGWRVGSSTLHSSAHFHRSNPTPVKRNAKMQILSGSLVVRGLRHLLWNLLKNAIKVPGSNDTVGYCGGACAIYQQNVTTCIQQRFQSCGRSFRWKRQLQASPFGNDIQTAFGGGRNYQIIIDCRISPYFRCS